MKVLIYEPNSSGHRFTYVRLLVQALAQLNVVPILVTDENAPLTQEFRHQIEPVLPLLKLEATLRLRPEQGGVSDPDLLLAAIARHEPNHVYIPYADVLAQHLGIRRFKRKPLWAPHVEVEALLMRGSFAYPGSFKSRLKARLSWKLATSVPWTTLFHLDPLVVRALGKTKHGIVLSPDPVEDFPAYPRSTARETLGLPQDGRYVGCVGGLDVRKGVDLLIKAFCARPVDPPTRLLLAGKVSPEIASLLADDNLVGDHRSSLCIIDRYLSNQEMDQALCALDVVCTPYPQHVGSASFVIRAAAAKRPVLGSGFGWLGFVIPRFQLGNCCRVEDVSAFASAINEALSHHATYEPGKRALEFREFHTVANFGAVWTARLRQRLGKSASPPAVNAEMFL